MPHRVDKVAAQLREELSEILARRVHDPRVARMTVQEVDVSPDLQNARVRVSTLGSDAERADGLKALEHARGFIRHELAHRLRTLRRVPELRFVDDRNIEYAVHIGEVMKHLHDNEQDAG